MQIQGSKERFLKLLFIKTFSFYVGIHLVNSLFQEDELFFPAMQDLIDLFGSTAEVKVIEAAQPATPEESGAADADTGSDQ